ncbi:MAG: Multi-sensor signal transduction histidine kinase [Candidatus Ozemobacter sibiricus]|uniref:histidine kinase n=1 Tax=Candidatus Ozemobacter sibiricus TaxID=2268124 RepID=A0A367ZQ64_9BACT|nr:MAG: Multi-sensor signal transduction histidine kinase [Candidatus Ozemobacter sibiricus]
MGALFRGARVGYHAVMGLPGARWSHLIPRTLFGRAFLSVFGLSLLLVTVVGAWFHHRTFTRLDAEASHRLLLGARLLAGELAAFRSPESQEGQPPASGSAGAGPDPETVNAWLARRFEVGQSMGWIQNVYWVDLREGRARFLASYSVAAAGRATLLPPTLDEIEDLIDQGLNALDAGQPAFPDPFTQASSRRFKIVLWPLLDDDGFLDSVIGLEADLDYLDLAVATRQTTAWAVLLAVPLCALTSYWWARGASRRIDRLLADLERLARRDPVVAEELGIRELDALRRGLVDLGRQVEARDRHLQMVHAEKLQELALLGGAIAHEIRNPLSAIDLHLGLLRRAAAGADGALADACREIQDQVARLQSLVERFLAYTRRVEPRLEPLDLVTVVAEAMGRAARLPPAFVWRWQGTDEMAAPLAPETVDPAAVAPATPGGNQARASGSEAMAGPGRPCGPGWRVRGDPAMLAQVLDNLIANARAARPEGLVIELALERADGRVALSLCDNGPGLPPSVAERLFTPFVTGRPDGHGIGLALSRKLIEAQGGRLSWRPVPPPGQGACFCIELPEVP